MTLDEATRRLADAGIDNPRAEARLLLAHVLGISRDATLTAQATPDQSARFAALVARRIGREPFAYITGRKEFWSLDFQVGPGVLVPRPETETLIEEAIRLVPDRNAPLRIADLGTGSGAILIAALTEFPNASGVGFESSPQAHRWASINAARLIGARAQIRLEDWDSAEGPFDLVFSNPPYIASGDIRSLECRMWPGTSPAPPWMAAGTAWRPTGTLRNCCRGFWRRAVMPCWKSAGAGK